MPRLFYRFHNPKLYWKDYLGDATTVRGVSRWFPENRIIKKTDRVSTFSIFSFCQYGLQRSSRTSGRALITGGAPRQVRRHAISRTPISVLLGGLLSENEGGQLSLRPRLPLKQWERCLRMSKDRDLHCFGRLIRPESLLFHLQGKPFVNTPGRLLWELCHSHESSLNRSGQHLKGLSKFPDILSPVILQFGGHISDGSLCVNISLIGGGCRRFLYLAFDKQLKLHSRQGLVMVDLLDNFLNPLKLFMGLASDFTKSL
jgi:hypothetical protein